MLVTLVPMFEPKIIGIALVIESDWEATSDTTIEVVQELDCSILVTSNPMNNPVTGLSVVDINVFSKSFPKDLKEELIKLMAKRKT
jgi:hypothetical protein